MTKIISLSGKKQSGKSSACEWIKSSIVKKELNLKINLSQFSNGHMAIEYNDNIYPSLEKLVERYEGSDFSYSNYVHYMDSINKTCKIYSFADVLKEICVTIFGLTPNQVNGTDEEKNTFTNFSWEKIPLDIRMLDCNNKPKTGKITARELLQYFGTDICRKMFDQDIWVNSTLNKIKKDNPKFALISDMRFKTELNAISSIQDSLIIRLNRNNNFTDSHSSEKDLDDVKWSDINNCLFIPASYEVHEQSPEVIVDISEKNKMIDQFLQRRGIL